MAWKPCGWDELDNGKNYTEKRVRKLFGRRKYMTADQIFNLDIPDEDKIWAMLHKELMTEREMRLFACDCAERALQRERRAGREPDKRSWDAVHIARLYAEGKAAEDQLQVARAAAGAAARAAAWAAVRAAARAAAWAAAGAAGAASDAGAAAGAAGDAERKWQIERLMNL